MSIEEINQQCVKPNINTFLPFDERLWHPYWVVELSNNQQAYHKNGRRSWLELKEWLKINPDVYLKRLDFYFRDNHVHIAEGKEGYFFSHSIECWAGSASQQLFIGGYVQDGLIYRKKFLSPELVPKEGGDDIYPIDHEEMQRGLILWNTQTNI